MKTGTDASQAGVYVSQCCDYETTFTKGQTFTRCPKCSGLTKWKADKEKGKSTMAA